MVARVLTNGIKNMPQTSSCVEDPPRVDGVVLGAVKGTIQRNEKAQAQAQVQ